MLNVTCPNCKLTHKHSEEIKAELPFYICPTCKSDEFLTEADIFDDKLDEDDELLDEDDEAYDEDDESTNLAVASSYAETQICLCLKRIIKTFDEYTITGADLLVLSKMYMVLTDLSNYTIDGFLYFTVKSHGNSIMDFHEIHIDEDGLRLTSGTSYLDKDQCPEVESRIVFPYEDEYEALNAFDEIASFVNVVMSCLADPTSEIDAEDGTDDIEENETD